MRTRNQVLSNDGFIRLDNAFPKEIADECRAILWEVSGCDPNNPNTWTQPLIRIGELGDEPFKKAANNSLLLTPLISWQERETGFPEQH